MSERLPRVAVTRAREQADGLADLLEAAGFDVISCPTIRIVGPPNPTELEAAARSIGEFDWVVFTSSNAVRALSAELSRSRQDFATALARSKVACVGPGTAAVLAEHGRSADLVPPASEYLAEGLVQAFARAGVGRGTRVLVPQAERARPVLRDGLRQLGLAVTTVTAYRTVPDRDGIDSLRREIDAGRVDVIAFSSPSTIEFFVERAGADVGGARVAVIGPVAARAARRLGLPVHAEAGTHTAAGLAAAVSAAIGRSSK
ncbi:MAG TPA: uroporphyrinogen-III synthase [Longimicrobiales bacterium]|nr:uroporphyrinogen-III synthase [Longimicrobiales bacterium]